MSAKLWMKTRNSASSPLQRTSQGPAFHSLQLPPQLAPSTIRQAPKSASALHVTAPPFNRRFLKNDHHDLNHNFEFALNIDSNLPWLPSRDASSFLHQTSLHYAFANNAPTIVTSLSLYLFFRFEGGIGLLSTTDSLDNMSCRGQKSKRASR